MANKRTVYTKSKAVKSLARERVGSPPPSRVLDDKKPVSKPKHKKLVDHFSE